MKLSRKGVALGLVVGALAGGAGGALATGGGTTTTTTSPSPPFALGVGHFAGGPFAQGSVLTAAASYLGLSQSELQTQLQAGKSLADVAKAQGKSATGLEDAIVAAITSNVNANSALTADQKAVILAQVKTNIATMVNTTCAGRFGGGSAGRFGPGAGPMMGGMWQ